MEKSWRHNFRLGAAVASIGVAALIATGCSAAGNTTTDDSTTSDGPMRGGTLTMVQSSAINSWHPGTISAAQTFQRQQAVYDALLYVDDDGNIVPGIAESLETSDDGTTWILELRDGVVFTDGELFDAEAVKFNYDVIAEDGFSGGLAQSLTTEVVDPLHLKITLEDANPTLPYAIAESLPFIASPVSLAERGDVYATPVGAGPFVLESADSSAGEKFVRNPAYWDSSKPYVDELRTVIISDPAQRTLTVTQGGADSMNGYDFWYTDVAEDPAVQIQRLESGGVRSIFFNTDAGFFSDVRARQAAALAMNVDELIQANLSDPTVKGSASLFPESSVYFNSDFEIPTDDLAAAQKLFDEVRGSEDITVRFIVPSAPENIRTSELLQLQLEQLDGLTVDLVPVTLTDWRGTALDQDDFEIAFFPGVMDLNPVVTSLPNAFETGGKESWANFSNPEMDKALQELRLATGDERTAAVMNVQEILLQEVPIVPFAIDYRSFLLSSDLENVQLVRPYILLTQDVWLNR